MKYLLIWSLILSKLDQYGGFVPWFQVIIQIFSEYLNEDQWSAINFYTSVLIL